MATDFEILQRRVERIETLLAEVLPLIPLEMSSGEQTQKFVDGKDTDQREAPTGRVVTEPVIRR